MADFLEAYNVTLEHEGGYSNDVHDAGGETYKGISRKYNPSWEGWRVIDSCKKSAEFPDNAYNNKDLDTAVKNFYKSLYWDVNLLDQVKSQAIANEMFDTGVNMGTRRAGRFLQKALNLLNRNGRLFSDLVEDGKVGPNTLRALNRCLVEGDEAIIYKVMNLLQGNHYIEYMTKSSEQERYARGWLKRVNFIKE